jgi:hypothetical protein
MEKERIQFLVDQFNANQLTKAEERELESLIESGAIDLSELKPLNDLDAQIQQMPSPVPSADLDDRFYHMLALEKRQSKRNAFSWSTFFDWQTLLPRLAFAAVALVIGVGIGYVMKPSAATSTPSEDLHALSQQVTDLKEMMMLSLLEKESVSDRLKAVSLTEEITASDKVTKALLETLNNDENVNVRLAALDALKPYVGNSSVREALIKSIALQESPLVQVALAELMAAIQAKSSIREFQKIIESERTPEDVKKRIRESLKVLS